MDRLNEALAEILAIPTAYPKAQERLCLDCWVRGLERGEEYGLKMAADLLEGVKVFQDHHERIHKPLFGRIE